MKSMSEFVTMLEGFPDLEVSIIRDTRINKVLKQIIKLPSIPHESEFNFKTRSQALLDQWNKVMATDGTPAAGNASKNGVNGTSEPPAEEKAEEVEGEKAETKSSDDKKDAEKTSEEPQEKGSDKAEPAEPTKSEINSEEPEKAEAPAATATEVAA
jgi:nucleosome binding factor SPN SPT16 subunit